MNRFSVLTGVPEFTKGLVREIRVRWFHEELGIPYEEIRYPHAETKKDEYLRHQPFGQVPYFVSDDIEMFETGAILLHLAMKHNKLIPSDEKNRAHTLQWLFTALNSVEPYFFHYLMLSWDKDAGEATKSKAKEIVMNRLRVLSKELGERDYFGSEFSIAEIVMTTVLKTAHSQGFTAEFPNLIAYIQRNESRPACQRALNDHFELYKK